MKMFYILRIITELQLRRRTLNLMGADQNDSSVREATLYTDKTFRKSQRESESESKASVLIHGLQGGRGGRQSIGGGLKVPTRGSGWSAWGLGGSVISFGKGKCEPCQSLYCGQAYLIEPGCPTQSLWAWCPSTSFLVPSM